MVGLSDFRGPFIFNHTRPIHFYPPKCMGSLMVRLTWAAGKNPLHFTPPKCMGYFYNKDETGVKVGKSALIPPNHFNSWQTSPNRSQTW